MKIKIRKKTSLKNSNQQNIDDTFQIDKLFKGKKLLPLSAHISPTVEDCALVNNQMVKVKHKDGYDPDVVPSHNYLHLCLDKIKSLGWDSPLKKVDGMRQTPWFGRKVFIIPHDQLSEAEKLKFSAFSSIELIHPKEGAIIEFCVGRDYGEIL